MSLSDTKRRSIGGQANDQLVHSLVELEDHNRELVILTEMGDMLQICASIEEAYTIVASFAQMLFPDCSGVPVHVH